MDVRTTDTTKARIEAIHGFWKDGMSSSRIAAELSRIEGQRISRMVVIGIYKRNPDEMKDCPLPPPSRTTLGYRRRKKAASPAKPRVPREPRPTTAPRSKKQSNIVPFVLPASAFTYVPTHPTKRLLDLEAHECKWAMSGEGADIQFCAQEAAGSYCEHHRRMSIGQGTKSERMAVRAARKMA